MDWLGLPGWIASGVAAAIAAGLVGFGWRTLRRARRGEPGIRRTLALGQLNLGVLGLIACAVAVIVLAFEHRRRTVNPRGKSPEALVRLLFDRDRQVRLNACTWLQPPGPPAAIAVPGLTRALDDASQKVRLRVMQCLAKWRADAAPAGPRLAAFLAADPTSDDAVQAHVVLKRIGPAAAPALEPLFAHARAGVREAAGTTLMKIEPLPVEALARWLAGARGDAYDSALVTAAQADGPPAEGVATALRAALAARTDADARWRTAWALGTVAPEALSDPALGTDWLDAAVAATASAPPAWRPRACRLLGWLPPHAERSVAALAAAAADEVTAPQACAALAALGPAGRPAIPALVGLLATPAHAGRAIKALAAMGPPAADAVREALAATGDDPARARALAHALAQITDAIAAAR